MGVDHFRNLYFSRWPQSSKTFNEEKEGEKKKKNERFSALTGNKVPKVLQSKLQFKFLTLINQLPNMFY